MKKNYKYTFLLFVSLLVFTSQSFAQIIKGKIFDGQTKEPLIGANVQVLNTAIGTITNHLGQFELNYAEKSPTLKISMIGFQAQEVTVSENQALVISLEPAVETLQSVVVTANREAGLRTQTPIAISKLSPKLIDETKPTAFLRSLIKRLAY